MDDWTLVKGWPVGNAGLLFAGSTKLASSCTDGSRQPFRPPVVRLVHWNRAALHVCVVVSGDCSHVSPVSRSKTAWLLQSVSTMNRVAAACFWSHAGSA